MVLFRHPDWRTNRHDRYAWYINHGREAHDVTSRLDKKVVLDSLDDSAVASLFRRSMPVSTDRSLPTASTGL